ncbi:PREDICTED: uncharacterized protein LOC105524105 isoform X2 [Colobus angolensis palliatus]|uniref:uncharacterized protein LOC105524105 isoform X2 n=1 Tax=Colobus angolensis palliatus TaxID=336983 RepID=UPI0005F45F3D|nr:PREDICTED: uncharacterized protein LOC105524105 isoform X2 [Colobus angolensis palliatus]
MKAALVGVHQNTSMVYQLWLDYTQNTRDWVINKKRKFIWPTVLEPWRSKIKGLHLGSRMPHKGPWCTFCLLHLAPQWRFLLTRIQLNGWPESKLSAVRHNEKCFCVKDSMITHSTGRSKKAPSWK